MDLRTVRRDAEGFVRAVSAELYANLAGLKEEMDTASIYRDRKSVV